MRHETWVRSLGREDSLEEDTATHSSIPAWRVPWTAEAAGLQSIGLQRVRHNWSNLARTTCQSLFSLWEMDLCDRDVKIRQVLWHFLQDIIRKTERPWERKFIFLHMIPCTLMLSLSSWAPPWSNPSWGTLVSYSAKVIKASARSRWPQASLFLSSEALCHPSEEPNLCCTRTWCIPKWGGFGHCN